MKYLISTYKNFPIPYRYLWIGGVIGVLLDLSQNYAFHLIMRSDYQFSWFTMSIRFTCFFLVWGFLSPLIYDLALRYSAVLQSLRFQKIFKWLLISFGISFLHLIINAFLFDLVIYIKNGVFNNWLAPTYLARTAANFFASFTYYLLISAIFFFHIFLGKYLKKEKELNRAKLNALLMQLRPHFLFNTLHSVNTLIDLDSKAAQSMVTKLGNLLRQVIQSDQEHLITFEQELAFIKNYLDIEQVRFQDRLTVNYEIDENTLSAQLPKLILQPIVENTIKHGVAKLTDEGKINISSKLLTDSSGKPAFLDIQISDNGPGFNKDHKNLNGSGIGLRNVASRLQQHYDDQSQLNITSNDPNGASIRIIIPYHTKSKAYEY